MANASVVIQDLTYTADRAGQSLLISYLNGGVAGSESVTVTDVSGGTAAHIRVTIASGVSTATQVKAAVDANNKASELVNVTISGTAGTAQKTCNQASLSGGHAATKGTLTLQGTMVVTAKATGTGGNSTTLQLVGDVPITIGTITDGTHFVITSTPSMVAGATITQGAASTTIVTVTSATQLVVGSTAGFSTGAATVSVVAATPKVKVTGSDILVQVKDSATSFADLKTAIEGFAGATALVDLTGTGLSFAGKVRVASLASAVALSGGSAAVLPAVVVQDLTIASKTATNADNGKTYTYTTGATAGAEVVTVTSGNVSVQIANGVSTATQIKAALDAQATFTTPYTATISGTGATAQVTVNSASATGETVVPTSGKFINATTAALTGSFVGYQFGFSAKTIDIFNDETSGAKFVDYSFDGVNVAGRLLFGNHVTFYPEGGANFIALKGDAVTYRVNIAAL